MSYHIVRVNENGKSARVGDRGMTADQATDKASELRQARPAGSSIDFRVKPDSRR